MYLSSGLNIYNLFADISEDAKKELFRLVKKIPQVKKFIKKEIDNISGGEWGSVENCEENN